jgi:hypothetical protein
VRHCAAALVNQLFAVAIKNAVPETGDPILVVVDYPCVGELAAAGAKIRAGLLLRLQDA